MTLVHVAEVKRRFALSVRHVKAAPVAHLALILQITGFMARLADATHSCQPKVLLTYEIYTDPSAFHLYPVNLLRNVARLQVSVLWANRFLCSHVALNHHLHFMQSLEV